MLLGNGRGFSYGYNKITGIDGPKADILMDFGILRLKEGAAWSDERADLERAYLLMGGNVEFIWGKERRTVKRSSLFDESPWCLHVPAGVDVKIVAVSGDAEMSVHRTINAKRFPSKLYEPSECADEERGKGTLQETSTRIVRTIFDDTNAPDANLVLGEVIDMPGRWSSYPPHHHPQPEIYFYKFLPRNGFSLCAIGDEAHIIHENDTVLIREGQVHPHVSAPGYAMWYLWVIRHLDNNRYGPRSKTPIFVDEHAWTMYPGARVWEPKPRHPAAR